MRGKYGLMVDADAATDIEDLDRLLIRMRDVESTESAGPPAVPLEGGEGEGDRAVSATIQKHGMVVGSRAHMEGEAVAKVRMKQAGWVIRRCTAVLLCLSNAVVVGREFLCLGRVGGTGPCCLLCSVGCWTGKE